LECAVVHIPDVELDPEYQHHGLTRAIGLRSAVFVPLLRDGAPLGVIMVARAEPGPFPESQIELLKTFADQAVVAIENVRLFKELEEKNLALTQAHAQVTEALEQQTATGEILRVIASSPTELQPVFETIVASGVRLCNGNFCGLFTVEEGVIRFRAHNIDFAPAALAELRSAYPLALEAAQGPIGRAIRTGDIVHTLDMQGDAT